MYRRFAKIIRGLEIRGRNNLLKSLLRPAEIANVRSCSLRKLGLQPNYGPTRTYDLLEVLASVRVTPSPKDPDRFLVIAHMPRWLNLETAKAYQVRHGMAP